MLAGYGQLFLLESELGIGKTSLAENFALDAAATAARLLWAWCLRLVTENHIAPLSAPTRELLEVAAAIGSEFDLTALERASCRSSREIFDALAEAESAGLVTKLEGMPERRSVSRTDWFVMRFAKNIMPS
jgi:hypothetical protein